MSRREIAPAQAPVTVPEASVAAPEGSLGALAAAAIAGLGAVVGLVLAARHGTLDAEVVGLAEIAAGTTLLGLLIRRRRPAHGVGPILLAAGLLFGLTLLAGGVLATGPGAGAQVAYAWAWLGGGALTLVWTLLILALPEGEVGGGWRRRLLIGGGALVAVVAVAQYLVAPPGQVPVFPPVDAPAGLGGPLAQGDAWQPLFDLGASLTALLPVLALGGLVARLRTAGPVVRQQLKWVLVAVALTVVANVARVALEAAGGALATLGIALGLLADPLPTLGIALAVFRYRLWEIDLLVSRALAYAGVWVVLAAGFVAVALGAGLVAGGAEAGILGPLVLALVVAVLVQPLRAGLERRVRRALYGERPSGYAVVARFGETLAQARRVGELAPRTADAVRRALGVPWAGLWLPAGDGERAALRPAAVAGAPAGAAALVEHAVLDALRAVGGAALADDLAPAARDALAALGPGPPAAVAALVAGEELVGVLACGPRPRPREPLAGPDVELLAVLARESALALGTLRLEDELRRRLEELREQSEELRRSRQRLVGAQDAERRRLERDLHDGVQQQLVALAAKLRRASLATPDDLPALLREVAGEAEESTFALQELARGIYPSLLADQGLAAALRTHAARLPANVHVEVEPALAGRRFAREIEAALYFVALEALANAQKHAPGAGIGVSLRGAADGRGVVLEVHDDGEGFDPAAGTAGPGAGLENMGDRLAAVGGTLTIDSRPGAGAWVRAEVPLEAGVVALQRPNGEALR